MSDAERSATERLSRRNVMLRGTALAGGVAILGMTANRAAAQTKVSQKAVQYQDTPKGCPELRHMLPVPTAIGLEGCRRLHQSERLVRSST